MPYADLAPSVEGEDRASNRTEDRDPYLDWEELA